MMQILEKLKMPGSDIDVIVVPRHDGCMQLSLHLDMCEEDQVFEKDQKQV
ncbi:hypothetical protein [Alicyclobacillus ferrooxydans]|nr:hypothetical protein [Alicyclobacillus ferrooxydans]